MTATKTLSDEQIVHDVFRLERDLLASRFQHSQATLENTSKLGVIRKEIARLKTEARTREIAQGLRKDALFEKHRSTFEKGGAAAPAKEDTGGFLAGIVDKLTSKE